MSAEEVWHAQTEAVRRGGSDRMSGYGAGDLAGRRFESPVCFIYHVNASGLIDRVNEYAAAMPGLPA